MSEIKNNFAFDYPSSLLPVLAAPSRVFNVSHAYLTSIGPALIGLMLMLVASTCGAETRQIGEQAAVENRNIRMPSSGVFVRCSGIRQWFQLGTSQHDSR